MKVIENIAGGVAGAVVLNVLHESVRHFYEKAPRVDLIGEEALSKAINAAGLPKPGHKALYGLTLAGDILSNSLYYSAVGVGKNKNLFARGAGYGLAAGVGALILTRPLGLNDAPVNRSVPTKILTAVWYLVGGLVTALAIKSIRA